MRLSAALVMIAFAISATSAMGQVPDVPSDLQVLVGKKVVVGRMPLCEPKTYTANLQYAGKEATLVSFRGSEIAGMPPKILARMGPGIQGQMDDARRGGTLLFQFGDGTKLDTCVDQGFKQLAENLEVVPGQQIAAVPAPSSAGATHRELPLSLHRKTAPLP